MIIILRKKNEWYHLIKNEPPQADLLANFLTDDVGSSAINFISRFEKSDSIYGSHNATRYWQEEENVIFVEEWAKDDDEEIENGHYFTIRAVLLIQLLKEWEFIYPQRLEYIIIRIEANTLSIIGSNELPNIV